MALTRTTENLIRNSLNLWVNTYQYNFKKMFDPAVRKCHPGTALDNFIETS